MSEVGKALGAGKSGEQNKEKSDDDDDDDDDEEDDMFKGRMGYEDFMKKIERHQKDIFK